MLTISILLAVAAFITGVAEAMGKCPSWVPVIILSLFALVQSIPIK